MSGWGWCQMSGAVVIVGGGDGAVVNTTHTAKGAVWTAFPD